jgi:cytochrome c peroxidase
MINNKLIAILLLLSGIITLLASLSLSGGASAHSQRIEPNSGTRLKVPDIAQGPFSKNIARKNLMTSDKVALGEKLYFDKRLSADGTVSCATCHDPATAFASKDSIALGVKSQLGTRNAPTVLNARFSRSYFWDGRARTLEEQVKQPLLNPLEMGMENADALVARLSSIAEYRTKFRRVFRRKGITLDNIAKAIAAYERTLLSSNSPFDRFIRGDKKAFTAAQKNGWQLFKGKAKCIDCHSFSSSARFFTDFKFYNTGIAVRNQNFEELARRAVETTVSRRDATFNLSSLVHKPEFSELGRFLVTHQEKDIAAFKTPTLRDVELTGPYMHNGSLKTLLDVVRFYNEGGQKNPNLDDKMRTLNLNEKEMSDIVEFLRALTSDDVLRQAQSSKPQTRTPVPIPHFRTGNKQSVNQ